MSSETTVGGPVLIDPSEIPGVMPVLPLRNSVFFPGGVLPLAVGRPKSIGLVEDAVRADRLIAVVTQRRMEEEDPGSGGLYRTGTVARIVRTQKMGENDYGIVVHGLARVRVLDLFAETPYLHARVEHVPEPPRVDRVEIEALGIELKTVALQLVQTMPELPPEATEVIEWLTDPGQVADLLP
jgi:ATP-dependent Lon protease